MTAFTAGFTHLQLLVEGRKHNRVLSVCRDYRTSPWIVGSIVGVTYCLAELPNSFVKRRLGIAAGARSARANLVQHLADQTDSVLGCLVALRLLYPLQRGEMLLTLVLGSAVHVGVDRLTYVIGIKRRDR